MLSTLLALALAQSNAARVVVAPFAALQGDVPPRAGEKAAELLVEELKSTGGVEATLAQAGEGEGPAPALAAAQGQLAEARKALADRRPHEAARLLLDVVNKLSGPAASSADPGDLADAWAWLARARFLGGDDEGGRAALRAAVRMAPGREFAAAEGSPRFRALAGEERREGLADRGQLRVDSVPSGAAVLVDGQDLGRTPVLVTDVPAGDHLVQVSFPSGDAYGARVAVGAGKDAAHLVATSGGAGLVGRLDGALSRNRLTPEAIAAAKQLREAAHADAAVFGGLARGGKGLTLDAFLLGRDGSVKRLPRVSLDAELIGAGADLGPVATAASQGQGKDGWPGDAIAKDVAADAEERASERPYPTGAPAEKQESGGPRRVITGPAAPERRRPAK